MNPAKLLVFTALSEGGSLFVAADVVGCEDSACDAQPIETLTPVLLQHKMSGRAKLNLAVEDDAASSKVHVINSISPTMQAILDAHNAMRCMHGVPPMVWDATIAANAQAWADAGQYGHSPYAFRNLATGYVGENLAWGYPTRTGQDSVEGWYSEIEFTDGTPSSCEDTTAAGAGEAICHYTQVVWKASTKLGCGQGRAPYMGDEGDFWVCQYGPGGNYQGEFDAQVLAPVKTADECGAATPAPAPVPQEPSQNSACTDGGADDSPVITWENGAKATCSELGGFCGIGFDWVDDKCKSTCGKC